VAKVVLVVRGAYVFFKFAAILVNVIDQVDKCFSPKKVNY